MDMRPPPVVLNGMGVKLGKILRVLFVFFTKIVLERGGVSVKDGDAGVEK